MSEKHESANKERFAVYMRGWRHGASGRAKPDTESWRADLRSTYEAGYRHGVDDCRRVTGDVAGTYGYHPSVLRGQDDVAGGAAHHETLRQLAAVAAERDELKRRVEELEREIAEPIVDPLDRKRTCAYCGEQTRITTAGCDHCDVEDK